MTKSKLMRRCANVSTLDLEGIKSDLLGHGGNFPRREEGKNEGEKGHLFRDYRNDLTCFPQTSQMTYLCTHNPTPFEYLLTPFRTFVIP